MSQHAVRVIVCRLSWRSWASLLSSPSLRCRCQRYARIRFWLLESHYVDHDVGSQQILSDSQSALGLVGSERDMLISELSATRKKNKMLRNKLQRCKEARDGRTPRHHQVRQSSSFSCGYDGYDRLNATPCGLLRPIRRQRSAFVVCAEHEEQSWR